MARWECEDTGCYGVGDSLSAFFLFWVCPISPEKVRAEVFAGCTASQAWPTPFLGD